MTLFPSSDVQDIHDVLEVTVYDEDKDHKYEFLGKVDIILSTFFLLGKVDIILRTSFLHRPPTQIMVPLLWIKNGERKWIRLKDKSLRKRAKGEEPQILLEMNVFWNP